MLYQDTTEQHNFMSVQSLVKYVKDHYSDTHFPSALDDMFIRFKTSINDEGESTVSFEFFTDISSDQRSVDQIKLRNFEEIFKENT